MPRKQFETFLEKMSAYQKRADISSFIPEDKEDYSLELNPRPRPGR
jgi:hypothetical protein